MNQTVVVFDLDRTITKIDTYLLFLSFLILKNMFRVIAIPSLLISVLRYRFGNRTNTWLKEDFWAAIVKNRDISEIKNLGEKFSIFVCKSLIRPGAIKAIEAHKSAGHHLILASASFDVYVAPIATRLGFNATICTKAEISNDGALTGKIHGKNCYGEEKVLQINLYTKTTGMLNHKKVAYSDHHSDVDLLIWADKATAVHPTHQLKTMAEKHNFLIEKTW